MHNNVNTPVLNFKQLIFLFAACFAVPAYGLQEYITRWHADITVKPNATLQVKETISFIANNQIFNHGFFILTSQAHKNGNLRTQ